jgi:hypothetical protein
MSVHPGTSRWRLLVACLALAANLVAAGVPVLHALAHDAHFASVDHHADAVDDHGAELHEREAGHDHDRAHAASLHDECVALKRVAVDLGFIAPIRFALLSESETDRVVPRRPVQRLSSRAPPPGDPARAPPLV